MNASMAEDRRLGELCPTAREWHRAILAAHPDRPVSIRTVYYWIKKGTAPDWALKLKGTK